MDFGITNVVDLYKRVTPALNTKINELRRNNITYIKKEDIWNYLVQIKWANVKGFTLSEMVDDILNTDNIEIEKYMKKKLEESKREANFEDVEII